MKLHTAAPWSVCLTQLNGKIRVRAMGIPTIATLETRHISFNQDQANAKRIVACVNACDGVDDIDDIKFLLDAAKRYRLSASDLEREWNLRYLTDCAMGVT